jgi:DNA-binding transcriptional ArsR family regulator
VSNELMRLAWKVQIPTGRKVVLLALADMADKGGVCWPSRDLLAEMTGLAASRVSLHLRDLVADGLVEQTRRRQQSATYTVIRERLSTPQEVSNGEVSTPEDVPNEDISNQDVSNQDKSLSDRKTSRIETSLKRTPKNPHSRRKSDEEHPEARKLCERLVELMVANGCKKPTITKGWMDEGRRLLTLDNRPFAEALAVLEWSQANTFWRKNIRSLSKFREQYDRLRMDTEDDGKLTAKATAPSTPDSATDWVRNQWRDAATTGIEQATGLRYEPPDLPLDVTSKTAAEEFYRDHRRDWITQHHDSIIERLTRGNAA